MIEADGEKGKPMMQSARAGESDDTKAPSCLGVRGDNFHVIEVGQRESIESLMMTSYNRMREGDIYCMTANKAKMTQEFEN